MPIGATKALLESIATEVDRLPAAALRDLYPLLEQAKRELRRDLAVFLSRHSADRWTVHHYRMLLAQLEHTTRRLAILDRDFAALLGASAYRTAGVAVAHLARMIDQMSGQFKASLNPIPFHVIGQILEKDRTLMARHAASAARYGDVVRTDIRRQISLGMLRGENLDQMTVRLARRPAFTAAVDPSMRAEVITDGLFGRYRGWAERVVRTEVIHAYNHQADLALNEAAGYEPGLQREWNAALDGRVCLACRELDGKRTGMGESFPGGVMFPPLHPNCRCAVVAHHPSWTGAPISKAEPASTRKPPKPPKVVTSTKPPAGFKLPEGHRGKILPGIPTHAEAKASDNPLVRRVPLADLQRAGLFGLDSTRTGGVDNILRAWDEGKSLPPVKLLVDPQGRLYVDDGRHRLLAAMAEGKNREILVIVDYTSNATGSGTVELTAALRK